MIIALTLVDIVTSLGCTSKVVSRVANAMALLAEQRFDAAILDINLAGEPCYPMADALSTRAIPYIMTTGYGSEEMSGPYRDKPRLEKPYMPEQIKAALLQALGAKAT